MHESTALVCQMELRLIQSFFCVLLRCTRARESILLKSKMVDLEYAVIKHSKQ